MKVIVIIKASKSSEAGEMPSEQLLADMGAYNQQLIDAGIMLAGEGLHPSSKGVRVRFDGKKREVFDGPFAETKELIAGFWIWRVKSMAEAIEWLKKCPNPMDEVSDVEIRPVFEAEDFGAEFTPELREQEASQRAQTLGLSAIRFETAPAKVIAGTNASYDAQSRSKIPEQWMQFVHQMNHPARIDRDNSYGVSWNMKGDCNFDYLCGVEVAQGANLPAGWTKIDLPAQRYAIFTHGEHVSKLPECIDKIWSQWAPDCGLRLAKAPCVERYTKEFNGQSGGMEIWVALE